MNEMKRDTCIWKWHPGQNLGRGVFGAHDGITGDKSKPIKENRRNEVNRTDVWSMGQINIPACRVSPHVSVSQARALWALLLVIVDTMAREYLQRSSARVRYWPYFLPCFCYLDLYLFCFNNLQLDYLSFGYGATRARMLKIIWWLKDDLSCSCH